MSNTVNNYGSAGGDVNIGNKTITRKSTKNSTKIQISIGAIVVICVVAVVFLMVGSTEKKIVGQWQMERNGETYEFTKDGRMLRLTGSNDTEVTYTIDDNRIYLNFNVLWASATVSADISISGSTMTFSNFSDPDDIVGVDASEQWRFTKAN